MSASSSPSCKSIVASRAAMRPAGKARRPRVSGILEGGATQPDGMQRRSNADGVASRAARHADIADAAMKGDKTALRALLQQKEDVNAHQSAGAAALHWA